MGERVSAWVRPRGLVLYFVLAYTFSWLVELPLVATVQGWWGVSAPFWMHYLAAFGPMLAALVVTGAAEGVVGVRRLLGGLGKRVGGGWLLFSILFPLGLFGVAALAGYLGGGGWPNLALLGEVDYLPHLGAGVALALWLLTFGLGEELGWRGYALPRLQSRRTALGATAVLGLLWAFWHLPAFFYRDTYVAMGLVVGLPLFLLSILAASVVFTWLYNGSGGSLLVVVLFHGLFDFLSVSRAGGGAAAATMSAAVMVWAVLIVLIYKPLHLSRRPRQVA